MEIVRGCVNSDQLVINTYLGGEGNKVQQNTTVTPSFKGTRVLLWHKCKTWRNKKRLAGFEGSWQHVTIFLPVWQYFSYSTWNIWVLKQSSQSLFMVLRDTVSDVCSAFHNTVNEYTWYRGKLLQHRATLVTCLFIYRTVQGNYTRFMTTYLLLNHKLT